MPERARRRCGTVRQDGNHRGGLRHIAGHDAQPRAYGLAAGNSVGESASVAPGDTMRRTVGVAWLQHMPMADGTGMIPLRAPPSSRSIHEEWRSVLCHQDSVDGCESNGATTEKGHSGFRGGGRI